MRKLTLIAIAFLTILSAQAQITEVQKYDIVPDEFEECFNDLTKTFVGRLINTASGQYLGQVNDQGQLYGYGSYFSNDGSQIIGQFRSGKCIFGIMLGAKEATIGTKDFYACYSLETGALLFVYRNSIKQIADTKQCPDYRFESMTYQNGERYIGETLRGKRHGYGIYYYQNGNYWYGQYKDGVRNGFGALFTTDSRIIIGRWVNGSLEDKNFNKEKEITIKDILGHEN